MSEIKIELRGISKSFPGVKALDNVHFAVRKGTVHCLCGENGAGKSTLMKVINGLYKQDTGEVLIDGKPVESFKLSDEALATLSSDLQEMLGTEIEVDVLTIGMDALERIDEDPRYEALSPGEIGALGFMITEG